MTEDLTYDKIENRMRKAILALQSTGIQHADDLRSLATIESKFKFASASSFVRHRIAGNYEGVKMTDKLADSLAVMDTDQFRQEYEMAKANEQASKEAHQSIGRELEALRSLMASYRNPT